MTGWLQRLPRLWFWLGWTVTIFVFSCGILLGLYAAGAFTFVDRYEFRINPDFELNLAAEALGILFTVAVLDWLRRRHSKQETKPSRYVAVRSAYVDFSRAVDLWTRMLRAGYIPARDNGLLQDPAVSLFDPRLVLIVSRLQLEAPIYPDSGQTWRNYLIWQSEETVKGMVESLQASGAHMSPELLYALYDFRHQGFWSFWQHSHEAEAIRSRAAVPDSGQLDFGDPNTPYRFLESMRQLSSVLAKEIPEFQGMEDLPATIDPDCRWTIDEILSTGGQR